jgi:hypothetical protein
VALTPSEEAELRSFCHSHDIPVHVQARSRQIADEIKEDISLYAEVSGAC